MADHSKPVLTDNYTDVLSQIRGRLDDQAKQFDPALTSYTNIQTGTIRWDSASSKDQKWNGTAWVDKSSNYSFNQITLTGGTSNAIPYLNGSKVLTSGSALTFDGTALRVGGSTGLYFSGNTAGHAYMGVEGTSTADYLWFGTNSNIPIIHHINSSEQMRLTSTGLGIGTSSPAAKLDVVAAAFAGGPLISARFNTSNFRIGFGIGNNNGFPFLGVNVNNGAGGNDNGTFDINGYASRIRMDNGLTQFQVSSASGTAGGAITWNTQAILDTSGNLGLGVTPSAWGGSWRALEVAGGGAFAGAFNSAYMLGNAYYSASGGIYKATGAAGHYGIEAGTHVWKVAPSGTAGNAISFTQAMTLDASGNLLVANQNPVVTVNGVTNGEFGFDITGSSTRVASFLYNATTGAINIGGNQSYSFPVLLSGGSERARITSSGNLLVGNTNGTSKITASGVVESTTGGFKFPDGTTQTTAAVTTAPTTTNVLAATAGATAGAVGTYAFLCPVTLATYNPGDTLTGAFLRYADANTNYDGNILVSGGAAPSGTWRCMGYSTAGSGSIRKATSWLRIS